MINTEELKEIINSSWINLAVTFNRKDLSGGDVASVMITILARFLNVTAENCPKEDKDYLRKEFIDLIEEKLGK